ncbi:MAG: aspartate aminotransferase family protein [bacterium]
MHFTNRQLFLRHLALPSVDKEAPEIIKAEGIYLYDVDGHQYIDLVSGVSVSNTGHGHPRILVAIKKQLDDHMHLMVYGKYIQSPQVRLARKLADHLPDSLQSVYFVNSGSEAIEGALKLAKRVTGRTELVSCRHAYHGSTHGALSLLGDEEMKYAYRPLLPDTRLIRYNSLEDLNMLTENTAAFLIEPIQAEAGIILPEDGYLKAVRKRCDEVGCMLIFDEIQMGFGRTGKLFAFEHYGVVPDILCLAKALGGGMPLGAFISSRENMLLLTHHPELGHITTFGGHPVSCAASHAALDVILDEKLAEGADQKGELFENELDSHPVIKAIRRKGLMLGVELKDPLTLPALMRLFKKNRLIVDQFLFNHSSFRIAPPLTISEEQILPICDKIRSCLDEASR